MIIAGRKTPPGAETDPAETPLIDKKDEKGNQYLYPDVAVVAIPLDDRIDASGQSNESEKSDTNSDYVLSRDFDSVPPVEDQYPVLGSGGSSYDPAHLPDKTDPINLRVRPNVIYTKDCSDDKHPNFKFGTKNDKDQERVSINKVPWNAIPKNAYSREDSGDSSSSGGYARGRMQIVHFTRENSYASTDDTISSDVQDDVPFHAHITDEGTSQLPVKDVRTSGNLVLETLSEEHNIPKLSNEKPLLHSNEGDIITPQVRDQGITAALNSSNDSVPVTSSDSGIVQNSSSAENNQEESSPENDGLQWDSSDEDNDNYTKNKESKPVEIIDPDAEDYPDPEKEDNEENEGSGSLGLGIASNEDLDIAKRMTDRCTVSTSAMSNQKTSPAGDAVQQVMCEADNKVPVPSESYFNSVEPEQTQIHNILPGENNEDDNDDLAWDSDEDDDDSNAGNYTINKTKTPDLKYDSDADFPDPEKDGNNSQ